MPKKEEAKKVQIEEVEIDGVKYYEKSEKILVPIAEYGVESIRGRNINSEANIKVGFKIVPDDEYIMLKGYLNNKLIPNTGVQAQDSYGDIPVGQNVYDIQRLINNPVALVNHENSASKIAGNYIYLEENEQGLKFKLILRPIDTIHDQTTKDAVQVWSDGYGKAFSIGGRFLYDWEKSDPPNRIYYLIKAILHEASLVAIGADQWALDSIPNVSMIEDEGNEGKTLTLEEAIEEYIKTPSDELLEKINELRKGEKNNEQD